MLIYCKLQISVYTSPLKVLLHIIKFEKEWRRKKFAKSDINIGKRFKNSNYSVLIFFLICHVFNFLFQLPSLVQVLQAQVKVQK